MDEETTAERPAPKKKAKAAGTPETDKPFEEALKELETLAAQMERGDLTLDDAVAAYERGIDLSRLCRKKLDEAEAKIQKLTREHGLADFQPEVSEE